MVATSSLPCPLQSSVRQRTWLSRPTQVPSRSGTRDCFISCLHYPFWHTRASISTLRTSCSLSVLICCDTCGSQRGGGGLHLRLHAALASSSTTVFRSRVDTL